MGKKEKRDRKGNEAEAASEDTAMAATDDLGMADEPSSPEARKSDADWPTEAQMVGSLIAAIMDAPVDPDLDVDPEYVENLREEVAEMHARGVMVDIPWSGGDFDLDEFDDDDEPDESEPDPGEDSLEPPLTASPEESSMDRDPPPLWCPVCTCHVEPDVLRCSTCGTPFQGPAKRKPTTRPSVTYGDSGPFFDEKGRLFFGGCSTVFHLPDLPLGGDDGEEGDGHLRDSDLPGPLQGES
jgi:hypothetical protein